MSTTLAAPGDGYIKEARYRIRVRKASCPCTQQQRYMDIVVALAHLIAIIKVGAQAIHASRRLVYSENLGFSIQPYTHDMTR